MIHVFLTDHSDINTESEHPTLASELDAIIKTSLNESTKEDYASEVAPLTASFWLGLMVLLIIISAFAWALYFDHVNSFERGKYDQRVYDF